MRVCVCVCAYPILSTSLNRTHKFLIESDLARCTHTIGAHSRAPVGLTSTDSAANTRYALVCLHRSGSN